MALINKIKNKLFLNTNTSTNYLEKHVDLLINKIYAIPEPSFIRDWSSSCLASCHVLLKKILTEKENFLSKYKQEMSEEEVVMLIKMIVTSHYIVFINNFSPASLKKINLSKKDFEDSIFSLFDFNNEDRKNVKKLNEQYIKNTDKFPIATCDQIMKKLNIKAKDPALLVYLSGGLMGSYKAFNHELINAMKTN